jgi:LmbE family N-acetylglucosaminyl deacetylase
MLVPKKILVVAAHPDDEVLGCGGTIAKLTDRGSEVHVVFMSDGVTARAPTQQVLDVALSKRQVASERACNILGVKSVSFGVLLDNQMDSIPLLRIVQIIEAVIAAHEPDMILTHHPGDINVDHRRTHEAVVVACRPQLQNTVKTILCFEIPSSTEWQFAGSAPPFVPNWFVDISATLKRKLAALEAYEEELRDWPHPRSMQAVDHLARWRGAGVGVDACEAFVLGRNIE